MDASKRRVRVFAQIAVLLALAVASTAYLPALSATASASAAARVEGGFSVGVVNNNNGAATFISNEWVITPACATGACDVSAGNFMNGSPMAFTLEDGTYHAAWHMALGGFLLCNGTNYPMEADYTAQFTVTAEVVLAGETRARNFAGNGVGVLHRPATPCGPSGDMVLPYSFTGTYHPRLVVSSPTVFEDERLVNVRISLAEPYESVLEVAWTTTSFGATPGADYEETSGTIRFRPGGTLKKTVAVPIHEDAVHEYDEYIGITATTPGVPAGSGMIRIRNDDAAPTLSIGDASVTEGTGGTKKVSIPIALSAPSETFIAVDYRAIEGTATAPEDYRLPVGSAMFEAGTPLTVIAQATIVGDALAEGDETFTVVLRRPVGAKISDGTASITIVDNDVA